MLRTALLGGNTITLDADLSKYIETVSDQGVIEGLEVNSNSVAPGKAWVKATRSNGETIMTLVQNTEALSVDTTGTKKIWLEIRQEAIDNGALNNEDGTGIAEIKTGPSVPSQNSLLLASVEENVVKDERNLIPKIQSVAQRTDSLEEKMESAEGQISQLVEAGAPSYLGITGIVGEKYTMEDTLFLQKTPTLADSTIAINVGDSAENKEQHIQRIANGKASNQLKLKMDKFGLPTTNVIVEVRKGIKVDVSDTEAYRYGGDELLASASLPYTTFNTEAQEITPNLNQAFQLPKGELYSIVVKQENGIVNASNYYRLYCDSTQYSEAFSAVAVNGSSRVRNKLMPYCVSNAQCDCVSKPNPTILKIGNPNVIIPLISEEILISPGIGNTQTIYEYIAPNDIESITFSLSTRKVEYGQRSDLFYEIGGKKTYYWEDSTGSTFDNNLRTIKDIKKGDKILWKLNGRSYGGSTYIRSLKITDRQGISIVNNSHSPICYPQFLKNVGEEGKFTIFGVHTDNTRKTQEREYKTGTIIEIATSSDSGSKSMTTPCPGIVILSAWTGYKTVGCSINGITIIQLYNSNSGTISQTLAVPVKGGEIITVFKHYSDGGASAKFISL